MLTLKIVSKDGVVAAVECDSVHLTVCDDTNGRGGGSMGIRPGHIKSLISLDQGSVAAYIGEKEIFSCIVGGGFATVENDTVTVVTEKNNTIK